MKTEIRTIRCEALRVLREKVEECEKLAKKIGADAPKLEIVAEREVVRRLTADEADRRLCDTEVVTLLDVRIVGEIPSIDGYHLVAAIDRFEDSYLIRVAPGERLPEMYRTNDFSCDHCGVSRFRNVTYIIRHEESGFLRVGRNCMADFMPKDSAEMMLAAAANLFDFTDLFRSCGAEDDPLPKGVYDDRFSVYSRLELTAAIVRRVGWLSKAKAEGRNSTAAWVEDIDSPRKSDLARDFVRTNNIRVTDEDRETARMAIEWLKTQEANGNDYIHNLKTCCLSESCLAPANMNGVVCSLIAAYQTAMCRLKEQEIRRERAKDLRHVGAVKERLTLKLQPFFQRDFVSYYGTSTLIKFRDEDGNLFEWWASDAQSWLMVEDPDNEGRYKMNPNFLAFKATVKEHKRFNEEPITVITRVQLDKPKEKKPKKTKSA